MTEIVAPPHAMTVDAAPYWTACDEGRLELPRCGCCDAGCFFPPRLFCPTCGSRELEWVPSSGRGILYAATRVHFAPFARDIPIPFTVCLVDLEEGVRMLSHYLGDPAPAIGDPVEVRFARIVGTDQRLPVFVAREAA